MAGNTLYLSGQLGIDPVTLKLVPGGLVPETEQVRRLLSLKSKLEQMIKKKRFTQLWFHVIVTDTKVDITKSNSKNST